MRSQVTTTAFSGSNLDESLINVEDFRKKAESILPYEVYNYFAGGAEDEQALRRNEKSFSSYLLNYRVLTGVKSPNTHTKLDETTLAAPLLVAPMAYHKLAHSHGEEATSKACRDFGLAFIASTFSSVYLPTLIDTKHCYSPWLQIYLFKDREITRSLIQWSKEIGISTLVFTVDTPIYGKRERELKLKFNLPQDMTLPNLVEVGLKFPSDENMAKYCSQLLEPSLSWEDVEWIASLTDQKVYLKGVIHPGDTKIASNISCVKGIIISNHGGRQLDCAPSSIEVLEDHIQVGGDKLIFLVDGGIRRGSDIFKSLALGAKAVLVGRPILWGLAVEGAHGVQRVLETLTDELKMTMHLCGCADIPSIHKGYLKLQIC